MGKVKKIKIGAAKRAQHLKAKKRNTKLQIAQAKTEKFNKKGGQIKVEINNQRKIKKRKYESLTTVRNDLNDEQIYENIKDILEEEDLIEEESLEKRPKKNSENNKSSFLEVEYAKGNLVAETQKEINLLPIKSKYGEIIARTTKINYTGITKKEKPVEDNGVIEDSNNQESEDSDDDIIKDEGMSNDINIENKKFLTTTDLLYLREQEIKKQKYRIGIICSGILEKPEEKLKNFKALFNLLDERNETGAPNSFTVRKLACVSIAEIFKDILPEYRVGQVDPKMTTIRKTTLERITYENMLLQQFKKYLTKLEKITAFATKKNSVNTPIKEKFCEVVVVCLCEILSSHPYFNYVQNVAQLLVYMLNCKFRSIRERVNKCFKTLFETDKRLDMTLFIIRRINHLIKTKYNNVHIEMITCFMSLKIKNVNLDAEKENELKIKKLENFRQRLWNMSKKERKRQKKLRELNKELQETKAEENKQTKHYKLTEITKMVFTIYFRILKNDPNSKLLSSCLEGLAEFAHVINLDFFSDLIEVLHSLLQSSNLGYREELHCIETIFAILSGQGEVLNIDPIRFYGRLYNNILKVDAGISHNDVIIILRILNDVLIKKKKSISSQRLSAFVKRTIILSLHLLHNGALGCLSIIRNLLQLSSSLNTIIDTDCSIGSGQYDPFIEDPEYCNANCTSLYETSLLVNHYHPIVRKFASQITFGSSAANTDKLPAEIGKLSIEELYKNFDSSEMAFNPAIPVPILSHNKKSGPIKITSCYVKQSENSLKNIPNKPINFHEYLKH